MPANGLPLLLRSFGLTTMAGMWEESLARAEQEQWGYERLVRHLCESEAQDRRERRTQRLLKAAHLPDGKALGNLNEKLLPAKIRRLLPTLLEGHFVDRAENILAFGNPGSGKTHLLCAIAQELIHQGRRILFISCNLLVQELLIAKRDLKLARVLKQYAKYEALIIDDIGYVQQNREEMEVLFTLLADRYERSSIMITSNLPFSKWEQIFKDPMTTAAAIDRLVHHSIILELNLTSYRLEQSRKAKEPGADQSTQAGTQ